MRIGLDHAHPIDFTHQLNLTADQDLTHPVTPAQLTVSAVRHGYVSTTFTPHSSGASVSPSTRIITKYVYELLEKDCNLKKEILPVDATEGEPKSFIYVSEDALTNPEKIMVLIQGSGVVRAGQWARRLIINEDLNSGTQIPFINRAKERTYPRVELFPSIAASRLSRRPPLPV
ncbi:Protein FAM172A [Anabarilius grahami]|uniref:Protein FAM172A n=1 Tax=Anabarilius grahami TaxID=495550 RepID=A0A3N0Y416_ANAGA|nr:Protein FAM172A [Anabarilius grahami]